EKSRRIYDGAAKIKRRSADAFANQSRRALEALCNDRGADANNLAQKLRQLSERSEIPLVLAEMTDILRLIGNIGSHNDDISVGPEFVDVIDDFFRAVVEYVYIAPHRVEQVRQELEKARK